MHGTEGGPSGFEPLWLAFGSQGARRPGRDHKVVTRPGGNLALCSENARISHNKGLHQRRLGIDSAAEKKLLFPPVRSCRLKGTLGGGRYLFCSSTFVDWDRHPVLPQHPKRNREF